MKENLTPLSLQNTVPLPVNKADDWVYIWFKTIKAICPNMVM
jgi:hypothetical protein